MDKKYMTKTEAIMELTAMLDGWALDGLISEEELQKANELIEVII